MTHDGDRILNVAEAKRRFSELLDQVEEGRRFVISRRGRRVAALMPLDGIGTTALQPEPKGLLSAVGALADWEDLDDVVREVYRARLRSKGRPPPSID